MEQKIKMATYDSSTRKFVEIDPETETPISAMVPLFKSYNRKQQVVWVTIPGTTAADVYAKWVAQAR